MSALMVEEMVQMYVVGIDGTNLRRGGGLTHLQELIAAAQPVDQGIARVVVWGAKATLERIDKRPWLVKRDVPALSRGLLVRILWQRFRLIDEAKKSGCDVIFAPGGTYSAAFRPFVTMCRNMLVFDKQERRRFPWWTSRRLQYSILRHVQTRTFRNADAVIFLNDYAKKVVTGCTGGMYKNSRIIPHGVSKRFGLPPRVQRPIDSYSFERPMHVVYVSIINHYKHQWNVVEAVSTLRREGLPVALTLVGPAVPSAEAKLRRALRICDPEGSFVTLMGAVPFSELHGLYGTSDVGVFASSCENMPNILLEMMAAGLPIVSSDRGPMPEILGEAGLYCDPEDPHSIADGLRSAILDSNLRTSMAKKAYSAAAQFSWETCAASTFALLHEIARNYREHTV